MLKILWPHILFLLFISVSVRAEKPWYFDAIGLTETTMSLTDKNTPVVVSVVDSGVAFTGGLSDSEFAKFSFTQDGSPFPVKEPEALYIHGTAMASLIASRHGVYGVYPHALISSRRVIPDGVQDSWIRATESIMSNVFLAPGEEKIINISGGQKGISSASVWTELLSRMGRNNERLIVAAVGNDGADIRKLSAQQRIWPAAYHPVSSVNKKQDPVIRVAALAQYRKGETPVLHGGGITGSRFGNGWVDIAAPGQNITFLRPDGKTGIGSGTSEATAIVSGVLAAMVSCNPRATATELKRTLLESADKYPSLADKVTEGRVLNAEKAISMFCKKNYIPVRQGRMNEEL
ncbi:subtilase AB5 cytotoxin subunit A [Escherichia coli]|uniref:subtilase AB5 cytotoxin subunit A n=2 Tax=Escherichia coli TaxID=562 RepID=UPI00180F0352|nr:subtilase AB5 cytotoxin subunit A [Escherichia coli]EGT1037606.1 subtilase AB5 cytotoxin subunit A [Escherichia coli]MBB9356378.1 subtilase AB5 cytotoxin subunit A [Escherichia coli]